MPRLKIVCLSNSYGDWIAACEDRVKRGIKQRWCPGCSRWRWDDETCCPGVERLKREPIKRRQRD